MFIFHSSKGQKSKTKVLVDLVPGKDPLPWGQSAAFLLCLHLEERESCDLSSSSYEEPSVMGAPPSWPDPNLITSKGPTSNYRNTQG